MSLVIAYNDKSTNTLSFYAESGQADGLGNIENCLEPKIRKVDYEAGSVLIGAVGHSRQCQEALYNIDFDPRRDLSTREYFYHLVQHVIPNNEYFPNIIADDTPAGGILLGYKDAVFSIGEDGAVTHTEPPFHAIGIKSESLAIWYYCQHSRVPCDIPTIFKAIKIYNPDCLPYRIDRLDLKY